MEYRKTASRSPPSSLVQVSEWWSLTLLCLAGALSPGPSWMVIITMSATKGTHVGMSGALGHGFGITVFALITVFGLSSVLSLGEYISTILSLVGVTILIYFGFSLIRSGLPPIPESVSTTGGFISGFILAFINPKVLVFFVAIFGPFVDPTHTFLVQLSMALLAGGVDVIVYLGVAIMGVVLKKYLQSASILWINRSIGVFLIGSSTWLLWKLVSL